MILLLHESIPGPYGRRLNHVRPVVYSRLSEVPTLLLADPSVTITHHQRSRVGVESGAQPDGDGGGQGRSPGVQQERIAEENEAEEANPAVDSELETDQRLIEAAKTIQEAYRRHLERQRTVRHDAARRIQTAYRRYLKRKRLDRKGLDATQARYWQILRKKSMEMEWTKDSRYNILFRVPLACILVCLDTIGGFIESKKKEAKKRLASEGDKELEELMETLRQNR